MNIIIRQEQLKDYHETENLMREAFWDLYKPGADEHLILSQLRKSPAFIKELDLVACDGERIVGGIVYSKAKVINGENEFPVLCMGPLGILPEYQKRGIGSMLMEESIEKAKLLGYKGVIIFGDPTYYHRFGFKKAESYGIKTPIGQNLDAFMALELSDNSLNGVTGTFQEDEAFKVKPEDLEAFEKNFPNKEKHVTDTQLFH